MDLVLAGTVAAGTQKEMVLGIQKFVSEAYEFCLRPAGGMGALEAPHWGPGAKPLGSFAFLRKYHRGLSLNCKQSAFPNRFLRKLCR